MTPGDYLWTPQPAAAAWVRSKLEAALEENAWLEKFSQDLKYRTGTRLIDWLDHLSISSSEGLTENGFESGASGVFENGAGIFPKVLVDASQVEACCVGLKVERLEDFCHRHELAIESSSVRGGACDAVRMADLRFRGGGRITIVERHGSQATNKADAWDNDGLSEKDVQRVLQSFRDRNRDWDATDQVFDDAEERLTQAISLVGTSYACDLFFQAEREYWQSKNRAAQAQYQRQQDLGLGWANHDHHTYRCSRRWFAPLVRFLERLGFDCRERFYAGKDAGWGAQVLENADCGIVIFADVDLAEDEVMGDFPHQGLGPSSELGTVGLWCELHGDSFNTAGMHHLECQFDFEAARDQLAEVGIETMSPFTDFPHLKQGLYQRGTMECARKSFAAVGP